MQVGELFVKLGLDKTNFDSGLDNAKSKSESAVGSIGKKLSSLAGIALKASTVVAGALTAVGGFGVKYNADMEQTNISFKTLLGSADQANKMITDLKKLGADTPFEFEGLADSAKLMLAMGFDAKSILPNLNSVGDAVSAIGGNEETLNGVIMALGQMKTKGKISAEEMNQLAERGIDAWGIMSEQLGKSKEELMKLGQEGKLLSDKVLPKIIDGMGKKYKGAMIEQSKTFNGMLSTFKDNVKMFLGDATKPIFDGMKERLKGILDLLNKWSTDGTLKAWAEGIATAITTMWDVVGWILGKLADGAKLIADAYEKHKPQVEGFFSAVKDTAKDASDFIQTHFVPDVKVMTHTVKDNMGDSRVEVEKFGETLLLLKDIGKELWGVFTFLWDNVLGVYVGQAIDGATNAINGFMGLLNSMLTMIRDGLKALNDLAHFKNPINDPAIFPKTPRAMPAHAQGTNFFSGGLTWVGERGAELVNLPMGSQVIPNNKVNDALSGGGTNITIQQMTVRNDQDIKAVARELYNLQRSKQRLAGAH